MISEEIFKTSIFTKSTMRTLPFLLKKFNKEYYIVNLNFYTSQEISDISPKSDFFDILRKES